MIDSGCLLLLLLFRASSPTHFLKRDCFSKQKVEMPQNSIQKRSGMKAAALSGDHPQKQRERIVESLKSGRIDVIVATDVAARGRPGLNLWTSGLMLMVHVGLVAPATAPKTATTS